MEFVREYEKNGYINLEFSATEEEKKKIDEYCQKIGISINELVEKFLVWCVENPDEFSKWLKENRDDKLGKGIIGKSVLNRGDKVGFYITPYKEKKEIFCIGNVEIIDSYGTFEQNEEPSYDIMVENFNNSGERCLVKHVRESECYDIRKKVG